MWETQSLLYETYPIIPLPWPWIVAGSHTLWHYKCKACKVYLEGLPVQGLDAVPPEDQPLEVAQPPQHPARELRQVVGGHVEVPQPNIRTIITFFKEKYTQKIKLPYCRGREKRTNKIFVSIMWRHFEPRKFIINILQYFSICHRKTLFMAKNHFCLLIFGQKWREKKWNFLPHLLEFVFSHW